MIGIKNRLTGSVLKTVDADNLRGADLLGADLCGADLLGADLCDANLRDANLRDADLCDADLLGADLRDANLRDANLLGAKSAPMIIFGLEWSVIICGHGTMRIGCQKHSVQEWSDFDDDQIAKMSSNALCFWSQYKSMLMALCASYKHADQGDEK